MGSSTGDNVHRHRQLDQAFNRHDTDCSVTAYRERPDLTDVPGHAPASRPGR